MSALHPFGSDGPGSADARRPSANADDRQPSANADDRLPSANADDRLCSAKGCRASATVDLEWRNPGLHAASRRKHWLACAEHEQFLADFLDRRGFLLGRSPA